jgi:phosphatidylethanolamine/phosphatidyl-N-methylethanolamine N-methyltransferase
LIRNATKRSKLFFLKQYLQKPFGIGAITPSSKRLAQLMVGSLELQPHDVVVELGPGTGVFTRELLEQGVDPDKLILVEFNADFAKFLRGEFPGVRVVEGDAGELPKLLGVLGQGKIKRVVSGIPLRSLRPEHRKQITHAIGASLEPGGVAVQFSYLKTSPFPKTAAVEGGLSGNRVGLAMGNVPPAFVWKYVKLAQFPCLEV